MQASNHRGSFWICAASRSHMPSLALFGATGNTGKAVLALALEQGYVVRALVRSPEKVSVKHEKLTLIKRVGTMRWTRSRIRSRAASL